MRLTLQRFLPLIVCGLFSSNALSSDSIRLSCDQTYKQANSLNAFMLWKGMETCYYDEENLDNSMYLLITGQIRAKVDLSILPPTDQQNKKVRELYALLFYKFGGTGIDEFYRDTSATSRLFDKLESWQPDFNSNYSPNWKYQKTAYTSHYQRIINCEKQHRLSILKQHANLIQDDQYYALKSAYSLLKKENNGVFVEGTEDYAHSISLDMKMAEISRQYPLQLDNMESCDFSDINSEMTTRIQNK